MKERSVLVLGAGSWGTALALVLARNGCRTRIWDGDAGHLATLIAQRVNTRYLPGIAFPELLIPEPDLAPVLKDEPDIVVAVPCEALREVLQRMRELGAKPVRVCLASKGLEPGSHKLNHQVLEECFDACPVAVLSGPSFAKEVAGELPTAVTIASEHAGTASHFADLFHNDVFRIYTHTDVVGAQVGGAVKNVMAIAAGIADGLGFGANTRAALITRGLAEIMRLGAALGGRPETFMGLSGLGDLVLTCTDDQSRNRRLGLALARGRSVDEARAEIGQAIEGLRTVDVVRDLAGDLDIEMPISEQVFNVVHGKSSPRDAVQELLARERKGELGSRDD